MNSDYAYSCIMHPDEIVHCDNGRVCMFGINPISTRFIQQGMNENSENIYISHGITSKERKLERILKKERKK